MFQHYSYCATEKGPVLVELNSGSKLVSFYKLGQMPMEGDRDDGINCYLQHSRNLKGASYSCMASLSWQDLRSICRSKPFKGKEQKSTKDTRIVMDPLSIFADWAESHRLIEQESRHVSDRERMDSAVL